MGLNLKDIGQKILHPLKNDAKVTNPLIYLNPVTALASPVLLYKNLSTLQKQQAAKKAAEMGVPAESLTYQERNGAIEIANGSNSQSTQLPAWAIVTISLAGVSALVGLGFLIKKLVTK